LPLSEGPGIIKPIEGDEPDDSREEDEDAAGDDCIVAEEVQGV
jgi:hypothetical protein